MTYCPNHRSFSARPSSLLSTSSARQVLHPDEEHHEGRARPPEQSFVKSDVRAADVQKHHSVALQEHLTYNCLLSLQIATNEINQSIVLQGMN